jgi:hypothetical protein
MHVARQGIPILCNIDLDDLIAETPEEYARLIKDFGQRLGPIVCAPRGSAPALLAA